MQEEIEQKSFNIMISTTKLSARTVLRAVKAAFRLYQSKASQGKQSVRTLLRQNRGVSSVEISKTGIRGLERYAKKYGIDYAIRKDTSEVPPRYLVFFKAPDAEAFNSAFKEYSASLLNKHSIFITLCFFNADTIVGNMDSQIFLGGSEPTTLKDLSEMLGKETIDAFNTSDTRGNSPSYGTTFQKMGHELLSRDELAVLDGGKCILQLRGVRPFLSDKYDLTQHPNYKLTSDYDPKNTFDIEKYLNRKEKIHPGDEFIVVDADSLPSA